MRAVSGRGGVTAVAEGRHLSPSAVSPQLRPLEREAGVPILSKIPFLKRLFTNKSIAKDEQILLIQVRPTIIMQREIEQRQFPLLSSKLSN